MQIIRWKGRSIVSRVNPNVSWLTNRLPGRTWSETAFINLSHLLIPVVKAGTVLQFLLKMNQILHILALWLHWTGGLKKHIRFHDDQKGVDDSCRKSKIIMNGWQLSLECMNHALTFRHNLWLQPELMSASLSSTEFKNGDTSSLWKGHMSTKDDFNTDRSETISSQNDLSRGFNMRIVTEVEHC